MVEKSPTPMLRLTADNLCPSAMVVRSHDGAPAEEYAASLTILTMVEKFVDNNSGRVDINNAGFRGRLFITGTAHLSVTCMCHVASHARYTIVELTVMMYA